MDLKDLYREVILDHNRSPRNFGTLQPADAQANGHNPLCGDRLHLTLRLDGDRLTDVRFQGQGCAISVASASLMSEAVKGKSRAEVDSLYGQVHALLTGRPSSGAADLGKLAALGGVAEFPARVKCASLCWHTLEAALAQAPTRHSRTAGGGAAGEAADREAADGEAADGEGAAGEPSESNGSAADTNHTGQSPATVSTE